MQCACPQCALLMGWVQKGVLSKCKCPECGYVCDACLGTNSVLSAEELVRHAERVGLIEPSFPFAHGDDEKTPED